MNKLYTDSINTAKKQLEGIFSIPRECLLYERAKAEIIGVRINSKLPQITLVVRASGTKQEQTILYTPGIEALLKIEDPNISMVLNTWQRELEKAFKGFDPESEIPTILCQPMTNEEPEEDNSKLDENQDPSLEVEDPIPEDSVHAVPEDLIVWALSNLRTLTEEKASFKKDIPEEFSYLAASKRTITNIDILTELANRIPVED